MGMHFASNTWHPMASLTQPVSGPRLHEGDELISSRSDYTRQAADSFWLPTCQRFVVGTNPTPFTYLEPSFENPTLESPFFVS